MTSESFLIAWVAFIAPIVFTPGPVNITAASITIQSNWKQALPFLLGVNLINLVYCTAAATGLGALIAGSPSLSQVFQYAGSLFILFLAWKLLQAAHQRIELPEGTLPGFRSGVILNALNIKTVLVFGTLFAKFTTTDKPWLEQSLTLGTLGLLSCMAGQTSWVLGGRLISRFWDTHHRMLSYLCAGSLVFVGLWISLRTL